MLALFNALLSGDQDTLRSALLFGAVIGGILVGAGIIWEAKKLDAATATVFVGVALEAVCTIFLFTTDEKISREQQSTIIALETKIAPRSLTRDEATALSEKIKSFAGTPIDVYIFPAGTPDILPLGASMVAMLDHASWQIWRIETAVGGQYFSGVGVYVKPNAEDKMKKAHDALINALAAFNPDPNPSMAPTAGSFTVQGLNPGQPDLTRVPAPLTILIGTKP